ncbi:hypothetical protein E4S40_13025 [Algoriphagus kandeliae]|uniref:Uncharacterized protein n=1 Tax=Algoriphagus kandeliae TaxID=2562278 RepID=A0A4Y9QKE7_9BACT|nr:hypothetical protein [Algoriphagus kandeliae]TFV93181.1 hypothetical protein E4S40_13025 [Algoriphagus kandeliae]
MNFRKINLFFLIGITSLHFSCDSGDPIAKTEFGKIPTKSFYKNLIDEELVQVVYGGEEPYDTIYYFNINGDSTLKSVLWTHTDKYEFDTLQSIKINFGSDSVLFYDEMMFAPGKGEVSKEKLNLILEIYKKWYGEPKYSFSHNYSEVKISEIDSIFKNKKSQSEKESIISQFLGGEDDNYFLVWNPEGFNLMISYRWEEIDSTITNGFIKYEVINYDKILNKRKEEIRNNASINDFISLRFYLDEFTEGMPPFTDRLNLRMFSVSHNLPEEPRNIEKFKFDVIFEDEYKDTILVVQDLEYDGYGILESAYSTGYTTSPSGRIEYYVDYYRYNENGRAFEELRKLRERKFSRRNLDDIKISANIKSIVFENGDVLK